MELAIHNWMRPEPLQATLERITGLGYTALEIEGNPDKFDLPEALGLLRKYNIRCLGAVTMMNGERNLIARDVAQRGRSVAYIKSLVDMVFHLEGSLLTVVPCTVGKIIPEATPDEEWSWAVESLRACCDYATPRGVTIAIEPINRFETYFINRTDQALALAEAVGDDCGICLDIFHMNIEEEEWEQALQRASSRLKGFHVADNNRLAPGMGSFDWPHIIATLRACGFDGALSVEFCAPVDRTPANPFPGNTDLSGEQISDEERAYLEVHGSGAVNEAFYSMLTRVSAEHLVPLI